MKPIFSMLTILLFISTICLSQDIIKIKTKTNLVLNASFIKNIGIYVHGTEKEDWNLMQKYLDMTSIKDIQKDSIELFSISLKAKYPAMLSKYYYFFRKSGSNTIFYSNCDSLVCFKNNLYMLCFGREGFSIDKLKIEENAYQLVYGKLISQNNNCETYQAVSVRMIQRDGNLVVYWKIKDDCEEKEIRKSKKLY
jgi:hypothetical protein